MRPVLCLLLAACAGDDGERPGTRPRPTTPAETGQTGDTGEPVTEPPAFGAGCALTANALRASCTVTLVEPGPVEVEYARADGGGPVRVQASDAVAGQNVVPLWFLEAETEYAWTARAGGGEVTGRFTTGSLPEGSDVRLMGTGTPSAPYVGMVSPCIDGAYAVIVDTSTGRTVWYQDFGSTAYGFMDGATFTEDHTVLTITDGQVVETDLEGNERLRLELGADLPHRPHHDVFRKDGLTYVLFQETIEEGYDAYMLDGFYVYDAQAALVGEWHLRDFFAPAAPMDVLFPEDTSHANAIWVDDDGTVLFSMRHLSAIAAVRGDPYAPDFGELLWRMANPTSEFGTDFTYTVAASGPADFERQHNVHLLPDGRMVLFDNRSDVLEYSRAVELSFDAATGSAVFEQEHVLPTHCDFQGGAMETPTGNTLATCAPIRRAYEFDPDGQIVWDVEAYCETGLGSYIPRIVPLDW